VLLTRFTAEIPAPKRVLDIGVGQGRNALPLARAGCHVMGIDPSAEAIVHTERAAQEAGLTLELKQSDALTFEAKDHVFDAVLVFGLLQILSRDAINTLFARLRGWLTPGGLLFLSAWHQGDPSYAAINTQWQPLGEASFRREEGELRTFLAPGEILSLAHGFEALYHHEGLGPWHRHGAGEKERHGDVDFVGQLRASSTAAGEQRRG